MNDSSIFQLIQELENQHALFLDIQKTTLALQKVYREADFNQTKSIRLLTDCINSRQIYMQNVEKSRIIIDDIIQKLKIVYGINNLGDIRQLQCLPSTAAAKFDSIINSLTTLLEKIESTDTDNRKLLKEKMDFLKKEALSLQKNKKARSAYHPAVNQFEGYYVDTV